MQKLAEEIVLDEERHVLVIDGEDFPYYVAESGPIPESLSIDPDEMFVVWVPIITKSVRACPEFNYRRFGRDPLRLEQMRAWLKWELEG